MNFLTEQVVRCSETGIFSLAEAMAWFKGTRASLRVALSRAMATGDVVHIRRGLYCLSRELAPVLPHPYVIANLAYGPSYVSMETALEFHGWIPEAVHATISVTNSRRKAFDSAVGLFKYVPISQTPLMAGVERHDEDPSGTFFVASPLKALCDIVAERRLDWTSLEPFVDSFRIEWDSLDSISRKDVEALSRVYRSRRVATFLLGVSKELKQ